MSRINQENPPYITIVYLYGIYHINKMEWDERADGYMVVISKQTSCNTMDEAKSFASEWADKEGLEVR